MIRTNTQKLSFFWWIGLWKPPRTVTTHFYVDQLVEPFGPWSSVLRRNRDDVKISTETSKVKIVLKFLSQPNKSKFKLILSALIESTLKNQLLLPSSSPSDPLLFHKGWHTALPSMRRQAQQALLWLTRSNKFEKILKLKDSCQSETLKYPS